MVDFPDPDSPTSATDDLLGTLKDTPLRAWERPSYENVTFSDTHGSGEELKHDTERDWALTELDFTILND